MDARDARLREIAGIAVGLEAEFGNPAEMLIGQWAIESQWGARPVGNANYFGMKRAERHQRWCLSRTEEVWTQEQIDTWNLAHPDRPVTVLRPAAAGKWRVVIMAEFADYVSLAESARDNAALITQGAMYKPAWLEYQRSKDLAALCRRVASIYATASYGALLISIARQRNVREAVNQARKERGAIGA